MPSTIKDGGFCPICGVSQREWLNDGHNKECHFWKLQRPGDYDSKVGVQWIRHFRV